MVAVVPLFHLHPVQLGVLDLAMEMGTEMGMEISPHSAIPPGLVMVTEMGMVMGPVMVTEMGMVTATLLQPI